MRQNAVSTLRKHASARYAITPSKHKRRKQRRESVHTHALTYIVAYTRCTLALGHFLTLKQIRFRKVHIHYPDLATQTGAWECAYAHAHAPRYECKHHCICKCIRVVRCGTHWIAQRTSWYYICAQGCKHRLDIMHTCTHTHMHACTHPYDRVW